MNPFVNEAITVAKEAIRNYPSIKEEILGLVELMHDEIESGESPTNEANLCIGSIEGLVESLTKAVESLTKA
tara:strand:- start:292 stop:507 length:216 start_codon:yes stop_codon:yes gene_type:complete